MDSSISEGGVTPKVAWTKASEDRAAWIQPDIKHGEKILPPNEQASNNHFEDSEVLQPRSEPIGHSMATPLNTNQDRPTGGITPDWTGGTGSDSSR